MGGGQGVPVRWEGCICGLSSFEHILLEDLMTHKQMVADIEHSTPLKTLNVWLEACYSARIQAGGKAWSSSFLHCLGKHHWHSWLLSFRKCPATISCYIGWRIRAEDIICCFSKGKRFLLFILYSNDFLFLIRGRRDIIVSPDPFPLSITFCPSLLTAICNCF